MVTTALDLHKNQIEVDSEVTPISRNAYFLVHLKTCFDCPHQKEGNTEAEIDISTCEACLHDLLRSTGFINSIKHLDTELYDITISKKNPVNEQDESQDDDVIEKRSNEPQNPLHDEYYTQFSNPSTARSYTNWILDQVKSEKHRILNDAIKGSLFSKEIQERYIFPIFNELTDRDIIQVVDQDEETSEYHLITEVSTELDPDTQEESIPETQEFTEEDQKKQKFESWILEQIRSGNQKELKKALHGSMFANQVWENYGQPVFQSLLDHNIIEQDRKTGEYQIIGDETDNKDGNGHTHYVAYFAAGERRIKKCISLTEALEFVKEQQIQNYLISELRE